MKTFKIILFLIILTASIQYVTYTIIKHFSTKNTTKVFIWEGLEKDIPADGSYIQISGTVNDTIYLNNIDE